LLPAKCLPPRYLPPGSRIAKLDAVLDATVRWSFIGK
jgi:hypothetical protein